MVIVSHDREFLDQLCTKIVHTEFGLSRTYQGNYTRFTLAQEEAVAQQWAAWEKQQKEVARQVRLYMASSALGSGLSSFVAYIHRSCEVILNGHGSGDMVHDCFGTGKG